MEAFGLICTTIGFLYSVFKIDFVLDWFRYPWIYLGILVYAIVIIWWQEVRQITGILDGSSISITVKFGDILKERQNLFIPMNSKFQSCFKNSEIVSTKSVQGQVIRKYYENTPDNLDAQLKHKLEALNPGLHVPYPAGLTLVDKKKKQNLYFVVTADINDNGASRTTEDYILQALENFWDYLDDSPSNDLSLSVPLIGCGQGRLLNKQDRMMRNIFLSFITHIRRKNSSPIKNLIVYIPYEYLLHKQVDIQKIKQFVGYICSEPSPDKNFMSRGIED